MKHTAKLHRQAGAFIPHLVLLLLATCCGQLVGQPPATESAGGTDWLAAAIKEWDELDSASAFARLESAAPTEVAQRYMTLGRHFYRRERDLPRMMLTFRSGIDYALSEAAEREDTDSKAAAELRGLAKAMAYNLAANCWPCWDEMGISPSTTDLAIGLDAARINLRLAEELKRDDAVMANGHWLLGAQLLANGKFNAAREHFALAEASFGRANKAPDALMAKGYAALARRIEHPDDQTFQMALRVAIEALLLDASGDAKFYADQIRTAERVLLSRRQVKPD